MTCDDPRLEPSPALCVACEGETSATADDRSATPSCLALSASAASSGAFSIMWANGSPGSRSPSKVRNVGRTTSCRRLSVTTMSRMGCASTWCHTPIVSNSRRAAATMADARPSAPARASAGSATVTEKEGPSPWRNAIASARPAKPPPPIITSIRSRVRSLSITSEVPGRPRVFTMITAGGRNAIRSDRLTRRMKRV